MTFGWRGEIEQLRFSVSGSYSSLISTTGSSVRITCLLIKVLLS